MRGLLLLGLLLGLTADVTAQDGLIAVIPEPARMRTGKGVFRLGPQTRILVEAGSPEIRSIGRRLAVVLEIVDLIDQTLSHGVKPAYKRRVI